MICKKTLKELYIGIVIVSAAFLLLGIIFMRPYWMFAIGILIGILCAFLWVYNMYDTLDRALDLGKKKAKGFVAIRSILRQLLITAILGVTVYLNWVLFVGTTIGLLSVKISGLINPHIRKWCNRNGDNRDNSEHSDEDKGQDNVDNRV